MDYGRISKLAIVSAMIVVLSGCSQQQFDDWTFPTRSDCKDLSKIELDAIDKQTVTLSEEHKSMAPWASEAIDKQLAEYKEEVKRLKELVDKHEGSIQTNGKEIGKVVADIAARFWGINLPLDKWFAEKETATTNKFETKIKEGEQKTAASVNTKIEESEQKTAADLNVLRTALENNKTAQKMSENELAALRTSFIENKTELLNSLKDPAQMRAAVMQIARDSGLSPETIAALKESDDQSLLELILTLVGGGTLGTLASRMGPSRSQRETDDLKRKIELIERTFSGEKIHSSYNVGS